MAYPHRVLVIDDEVRVQSALGVALEAAGYLPLHAVAGVAGLEAMQAEAPDAVLLDLMLPDMDGIAFLQEVRRAFYGPILVVSKRSSETDIIRALDLGADDYLKKPFGLGELLARLRRALRMRATLSERGHSSNDEALSIDRALAQARLHGKPLHLSAMEFRLLTQLLDRRGQTLSYSELLDAVWPHEAAPRLANLRSLVSSLRRKIEIEPRLPALIVTDEGRGYRATSQTPTSQNIP